MNKPLKWVLWISFFTWIAFTAVINFTRLSFLTWPVTYFYAVGYSFLVMLSVLFMFRKSLNSAEGKVFGVVFGIMLFSFLSQLSWVLLNIIPKESIAPSVFLGVFMNLSRAAAYLLTLILLIKIVKYYKPQVSWGKQTIWVLSAFLVILAFDVAFFHRMLLTTIGEGSFFLITKDLIDLACPVLNILLLLFSLWLFISLVTYKKSAAYTVLGLGVISLIDLFFVSLLNMEYYSQKLSFLIGIGYTLEYMMLATAAIKLRYGAEIAKLQLDKKIMALLEYIRSNPGCIKKDITRYFSITRMTTNEWLSRLSNLELIQEQRRGRVRHIGLSEKGKAIVT